MKTTLGAPTVTLYCVVRGPIYERYWGQLWKDAHDQWFPAGPREIVRLPGRAGWPYGSASRYGVALEHRHLLTGQYVFQIDADMRILAPVGEEILADGLTVTVHPGFPLGSDPGRFPYERNPNSTAYVAAGAGTTYHPGCFVGGRAAEFWQLAEHLDRMIETDHANGTDAVWYEESHLNKYLIDHPPAKVLDERYCSWGVRDGAIIAHLDKTAEEFAGRG